MISIIKSNDAKVIHEKRELGSFRTRINFLKTIGESCFVLSFFFTTFYKNQNNTFQQKPITNKILKKMKVLKHFRTLILKSMLFERGGSFVTPFSIFFLICSKSE